MGGIIGLTTRFSDGSGYRGSCWTNTLPEGLFAAPFYLPDQSEQHTRQWLDNILVNRASHPEIESLWGGHNKLAPIEYGLVIVDYKTNTLVSCQGYSSPERIYAFKDDEARQEKWDALETAGLLRPDPLRPPDEISKFALVTLPFEHTIFGDTDDCNALLQAWCEEHFGLTEAEREAWAEWHKRWEDEA